MTISFSQTFLVQEVFVFLAVFARLGAMVMVFPALGAESVPPRVRLLVAIALTLVVMPLVATGYPQAPATPFALASFVSLEVVLGLMIGAVVRFVMSGVQVAGSVIAYQTGLAFAQNFDPTQGVQNALVGTFLSLTAVTFIFATDLHHLMIAGLYNSYEVFPPGARFSISDFTQLAIDTVAGSFVLGIQLAAPFLTVGLIFYLAIGILSKLMPQVQIFFVAMPANILLGFVILMLVLSTMMLWFSDHVKLVLESFLI